MRQSTTCEDCGVTLPAPKRGPARRRCTPCRQHSSEDARSARLPVRRCAGVKCDREFQPRFAEQQYCRAGCTRLGKRSWDDSPRECAAESCEQIFQPRYDRHRFCSVTCRNVAKRVEIAADSEAARLLKWRRKNNRRRREVKREPYTLREIAARDRYRCQLCREPVDMTLTGMDVWGPTIDHIIPLCPPPPASRAVTTLARTFS